MRCRLVALAAGVALAASMSIALAAEGDGTVPVNGGGKKGAEGGKIGTRPGGKLGEKAGAMSRPGAIDPAVAKEKVQGLLKEWNIDADKQAKVMDAVKAYFDAIEKQRNENRAKMEDIAKREQGAKDEAERAKIREERRALMAGAREFGDKLNAQLAELLTAEQTQKVMEVVAPPPAGARLQELLTQLNLTDSQKAQAKEIMDAAREEAAKAEGPARLEAYRAAMEKVRDTVLTAEQKAQLEKLQSQMPTSRPGGPGIGGKKGGEGAAPPAGGKGGKARGGEGIK